VRYPLTIIGSSNWSLRGKATLIKDHMKEMILGKLIPIVLLIILPIHRGYCHFPRRPGGLQLNARLDPDAAQVWPLPLDRPLQADDVEVLRVLGKIDIQADKRTLDEARRELGKLDNISDDVLRAFPTKPGRVTSVRVFEARLTDGTRCFLKEYLPVGLQFGRRELSTTRTLTKSWNLMFEGLEKGGDEIESSLNIKDNNILAPEMTAARMSAVSSKSWLKAPFPTLLGIMKTDKSIEDEGFRIRWSKQFPRTKPPDAGNLWLLFQLDESSFKSLKTFPPLPQIVEGFDYFRKDSRVAKRWKFVRKIFKRSLESISFLHGCGFCHNAVSTASTWLTTTNQQEIDDLFVKITDLGVVQKFKDLGPYAKEAALNDLYQLGFCFLELVLASFSEDNMGASVARSKIGGSEEVKTTSIFAKAEELDFTQLSQKELVVVFENYCDSDFAELRTFVGSIKAWKEPYDMLEKDEGAAWKLIFNLLAKGRLRENDDLTKMVKIAPRQLINDFSGTLFFDL